MWKWIEFTFFCGLPAMLEEPLRFSLSRCLSVWMDVWMYICGLLVNRKANFVYDFCETWHVGSGRHRHYLRGVSSPNVYIAHLHICSDWLIVTKANIQSSRWATVTKLGVWEVLGTRSVVTKWACQIVHCILFWLAITTKANIQSSVWATLMKVSMSVVLHSSNTHCSVVVDAHIKFLICIFPKVAYAVYSMNIVSA